MFENYGVLQRVFEKSRKIIQKNKKHREDPSET